MLNVNNNVALPVRSMHVSVNAYTFTTLSPLDPANQTVGVDVCLVSSSTLTVTRVRRCVRVALWTGRGGNCNRSSYPRPIQASAMAGTSSVVGNRLNLASAGGQIL